MYLWYLDRPVQFSSAGLNGGLYKQWQCQTTTPGITFPTLCEKRVVSSTKERLGARPTTYYSYPRSLINQLFLCSWTVTSVTHESKQQSLNEMKRLEMLLLFLDNMLYCTLFTHIAILCRIVSWIFAAASVLWGPNTNFSAWCNMGVPVGYIVSSPGVAGRGIMWTLPSWTKTWNSPLRNIVQL